MSSVGRRHLVHILYSLFLAALKGKGPGVEYWMSIFNAWVKEGAEQQKTTQWQHQETKMKSSRRKQAIVSNVIFLEKGS